MAELDPDISDLIAMVGEDATRPKLYEVAPEESRRLYVRSMEAMAGPKIEVAEIRDAAIDGPAGPLKLRVYRPHGLTDAAAPALVFFHGGGWVLGDLDTHDKGCRRLAAGSHRVVVAVDYRLAPEHKFPAAIKDAYAATAHIAHHATEFGIDPARLVVGGDSAGGNIAAVVAHLARDAGLALAGQLLIYPATTGRTDTASFDANAEGYLLERAAMTWFYAQYARDGADHDDPLFAPLRAPNLEGLAPAIVVTAGFDPLLDDGRLYAQALGKSGVAVRHLDFANLTHGFFQMDGVSAGARAANEAICAALRGL